MQSRVVERAAGQLSDLGEVTLLVGAQGPSSKKAVLLSSPSWRSFGRMDGCSGVGVPGSGLAQ